MGLKQFFLMPSYLCFRMSWLSFCVPSSVPVVEGCSIVIPGPFIAAFLSISTVRYHIMADTLYKNAD